MTRSSRWAGLVLATCAIALVGVSPTTCGERVYVYVQLERAPIESSASGEILLQMTRHRSMLQLNVRGLDPESEYLLLADGLERALFTTGPHGKAGIRLRYPTSSAGAELDFDPRGKRISVSDGSHERLSAVVTGPLEPFLAQVSETASIPPTEPEEVGRAKGAYQTLPLGCRVFNVSLQDVAAGTYQVVVDGDPVGEVEAEGEATIRFWSGRHPGKSCLAFLDRGRGARRARSVVLASLDFEPRGAWIEVVRDGEVLFAGPMRAQVALPAEAQACPPVDIEVDLTPLQFQWFASGEASLQSEDEGCDHEFRVTVQGVPVANYQLWVAGAMVGTLPVRYWQGGPRGMIRFDTQPDDPDEFPLEFDPRGQLVEIRRPVSTTTVPYLEVVFPTE